MLYFILHFAWQKKKKEQTYILLPVHGVYPSKWHKPIFAQTCHLALSLTINMKR